MHDASKVLLGSVGSNVLWVSQFSGSPSTYLAGLFVSEANTGALSLLKSAGARVGVSAGATLSNDAGCTSVIRKGLKVPARLSLKRASGVITVTSYANLLTTNPDTVTVGATVFTAQSGAATPGAAVFRAATGNTETALSLATQINAHATASTKVYAVASGATVTLYSIAEGVGSTGTGNDIVLSYADVGTASIGITLSGLSGGKLSGGSDDIDDIDYATLGAKVYINDVTGKADKNISGFTTISDAQYSSGILTGVTESATEVAAVLVDMPGGL
jgi:hypothetical protein